MVIKSNIQAVLGAPAHRRRGVAVSARVISHKTDCLQGNEIAQLRASFSVMLLQKCAAVAGSRRDAIIACDCLNACSPQPSDRAPRRQNRAASFRSPP